MTDAVDICDCGSLKMGLTTWCRRLGRFFLNIYGYVMWLIFGIKLYEISSDLIITNIPGSQDLRRCFCRGKRIANGARNGSLNCSDDLGWPHPFSILADCWGKDLKVTTFGRKLIKAQYQEALVQRLAIQQTLRKHAGISVVPIKHPIFIVGPMFSGCNQLQALLAQDPANQVPQLWQLLNPTPPPKSTESPADARIRETNRYIGWLTSFCPSIELILAKYATYPAACSHVLQRSFIDLLPPVVGLNMSEYRQWLKGCSRSEMVKVYQYYKKQLQLLAFNQGFGWRTFVLQDPTHMLFLDALLEVFPDACIVQMHCSPVLAASQYCTLYSQIAELFYRKRDINLNALGLRVLDLLTWLYEKSLTTRKRHANNNFTSQMEENVTFLDVNYENYLQDPLEVVKCIYDKMGLTVSQEAILNMKEYLRDGEMKATSGKFDHSLSKFGISEEQLKLLFGEYTRFFQVH
ncbi:uncharacterized protein LOC106167569 [Lingula anatina]|uniref:Uncharacterized protein LOC106167569 n=1 Tax=Lingula anatina TaxID=7574 RepID=A0A1S3IUE0_LINAN|nr:uncharacterized protein LOC106167569 [Lingula anatina]|eukprot:XP_013401825.1 uncharacterized protein LOC106167569 [Lingula anatina]